MRPAMPFISPFHSSNSALSFTTWVEEKERRCVSSRLVLPRYHRVGDQGDPAHGLRTYTATVCHAPAWLPLQGSPASSKLSWPGLNILQHFPSQNHPPFSTLTSAAMRAPWVGGLDHMGRAMRLSWDSTRLAPSAFEHSTTVAPTRSPYCGQNSGHGRGHGNVSSRPCRRSNLPTNPPHTRLKFVLTATSEIPTSHTSTSHPPGPGSWSRTGSQSSPGPCQQTGGGRRHPCPGHQWQNPAVQIGQYRSGHMIQQQQVRAVLPISCHGLRSVTQHLGSLKGFGARHASPAPIPLL